MNPFFSEIRRWTPDALESDPNNMQLTYCCHLRRSPQNCTSSNQKFIFGLLKSGGAIALFTDATEFDRHFLKIFHNQEAGK